MSSRGLVSWLRFDSPYCQADSLNMTCQDRLHYLAFALMISFLPLYCLKVEFVSGHCQHLHLLHPFWHYLNLLEADIQSLWQLSMVRLESFAIEVIERGSESGCSLQVLQVSCFDIWWSRKRIGGSQPPRRWKILFLVEFHLMSVRARKHHPTAMKFPPFITTARGAHQQQLPSVQFHGSNQRLFFQK